MTTIACTTPDYDMSAPLMTDADVLERVGSCIDQQSRTGRSLWIMFVDPGGVQLPVLVPIDGVPESPEPGDARAVCHLITQVLSDAAPGGSAVISLTRPGTGHVRESDQHWTSTLRKAAADEGTTLRMVCLATRDGIRRLDPLTSIGARARSGPSTGVGRRGHRGS
jgi:hypothetical protein